MRYWFQLGKSTTQKACCMDPDMTGTFRFETGQDLYSGLKETPLPLGFVRIYDPAVPLFEKRAFPMTSQQTAMFSRGSLLYLLPRLPSK